MKLVILGFILIIVIINMYLLFSNKEGYRNYKNPADFEDDSKLLGVDTEKGATEKCSTIEACVGIFKKKASNMYNFLKKAGTSYGITKPTPDIEKVWVIDDKNKELDAIWKGADERETERLAELTQSQKEIDDAMKNYDKDERMLETTLIPGAKIEGDDEALINSLNECNGNITGKGGIPEGANCTGFFKEYGKFNFYFLKKGTKGQSVKLMEDIGGKLIGSIYRHKTKYEEPEVVEEETPSPPPPDPGAETFRFYCANRSPGNRNDGVLPSSSKNLNDFQAINEDAAKTLASNQNPTVPYAQIECRRDIPFIECESGDGRKDDNGNLLCKEPISLDTYEYISKEKLGESSFKFGDTVNKGQIYCTKDSGGDTSKDLYEIETVDDCLEAANLFKESGDARFTNFNPHSVPNFESIDYSSGCIIESDGKVRFNNKAKSLTTTKNDSNLKGYICRKGKPQTTRELPKIKDVTIGPENKYINVTFTKNIYSNTRGDEGAPNTEDIINRNDFRVRLEDGPSNYFANSQGSTYEERQEARKYRPPKDIRNLENFQNIKEGYKKMTLDLDLMKNIQAGQKITIEPSSDSLYSASGHKIDASSKDVNLVDQEELVCNTYETDQSNDVFNVSSFTPDPVHCAGKYGRCFMEGSICKQKYEITTPAKYRGNSCTDAVGNVINDGHKKVCDGTGEGGWGDCPPIHCAGSWGSCDSNCEKTFTINTPASRGGNACAATNGQKKSCPPGEGACPMPINCVGGWDRTCGSDCTKQYTIHVNASGPPSVGAPCEAAQGATQNCTGGACPAKVDCVGSWSRCSANCLKTYNITQEASVGVRRPDGTIAGEGEKCPHDAGDIATCGDKPPTGDCPGPQNCEGEWETCGTNCKKKYKITKPAIASPYSGHDAPVPCEHDEGDEAECTGGNCPEPQDCVGDWGTCNSNCKKTYEITTAAQNSIGVLHGPAEDCNQADGTVADCNAGSGQCDESHFKWVEGTDFTSVPKQNFCDEMADKWIDKQNNGITCEYNMPPFAYLKNAGDGDDKNGPDCSNPDPAAASSKFTSIGCTNTTASLQARLKAKCVAGTFSSNGATLSYSEFNHNSDIDVDCPTDFTGSVKLNCNDGTVTKKSGDCTVAHAYYKVDGGPCDAVAHEIHNNDKCRDARTKLGLTKDYLEGWGGNSGMYTGCIEGPRIAINPKGGRTAGLNGKQICDRAGT